MTLGESRTPKSPRRWIWVHTPSSQRRTGGSYRRETTPSYPVSGGTSAAALHAHAHHSTRDDARSYGDASAYSGAFDSLLAGDCFSSRAPSGRYADFYTFTVIGTSPRTVTIGLQASTLSDAYLYLISGSSGKGTSYLESDDDSGGNRNARITSSASEKHGWLAVAGMM